MLCLLPVLLLALGARSQPAKELPLDGNALSGASLHCTVPGCRVGAIVTAGALLAER